MDIIDKVIIRIGGKDIEMDAEKAYQILKGFLGKTDIVIINPTYVPTYPTYPIFPQITWI